MNDTMRKFGWPGTLLCEFEHWVVLARPAQPTLGSLVLAARGQATAFADLPPGAHAELAIATATIERALRAAVDYGQINYLMLMMADRDVHFHVVPRYEGARDWNGRSFVDAGWPKVPDLASAVTLEGAELAALVAWLKGFFGSEA